MTKDAKATPLTATELAARKYEWMRLYAAQREESFEKQAGSVVATLERMIERVKENTYADRYGTHRTATERASTIVHELTWGLANTNMQQLLIAAGEADAARRALAATSEGPV